VLVGDPPFDPRDGVDAVERALGQREEHFARVVVQRVVSPAAFSAPIAGRADLGQAVER
jgi:hypothetical protein